MAKLNNWDIVALASLGTAWFLIALGTFAELPPDPWAWIALPLGLWPPFYVLRRYYWQ